MKISLSGSPYNWERNFFNQLSVHVCKGLCTSEAIPIGWGIEWKLTGIKIMFVLGLSLSLLVSLFSIVLGDFIELGT
jgi:hypothetical protein